MAKSLPFAESQKVETIQDCAKLCYQADKCSAAGFISPMETQKAVCIFVKEPESSDCQGLVDRVNTTDAQKPVVIDCITCLSTNIEASPATKTGIETTVTNSSIGTTVESSTAGSANLSLRTDLFSPTGATTEFANYVNQTEGNATATLAVSTLFPTGLN